MFTDSVHPTALLETDGSVYAGLSDGGLLVFDPRGTLVRRYDSADGLPGSEVSALAPSPGGGVALGNRAGLWFVHDGVARRVPPLVGVTALARDGRGRLWIGTHEGLTYLEGDELVLATRGIDVTSLAEDPSGDVWVGTRTSGILHVAGNFAERFVAQHGLASQGVSKIVPGPRGTMVALGTGSQGEDRFSYYDGERWYPFRLKQAGVRWQILDVMASARAFLLLTNFGYRRLVHPVPGTDGHGTVVEPLPLVPPPSASKKPGRADAPEPRGEPVARLHPLPELTRFGDPELDSGLAEAYERARAARARYFRLLAEHKAHEAELQELASRRDAAERLVAGLQRRLAAAEASGEESRAISRDLDEARLRARRNGVAYELALTRSAGRKAKLAEAKAEADQTRTAYLAMLDAAKAQLEHGSEPAVSAAVGLLPDRQEVLDVRAAAIGAVRWPKLRLAPVTGLPLVSPGRVTLWKGGRDRLWLGVVQAGLLRVEPRSTTWFGVGDLVPDRLSQGPVRDSMGRWWILTRRGRVLVFDVDRWVDPSGREAGGGGKPEGKALAITVGSSGHLSLATRVGRRLAFFERMEGIWQAAGEVPDLFAAGLDIAVELFVEDGHGGRWLALSMPGSSGDTPLGLLQVSADGSARLHRFEDRRIVSAEPGLELPSNRITALLSDRGRVFAGTPFGLCVFDGDRVVIHDENEGMDSESIKDLLRDSKGRIWVATGEGVAMFPLGVTWTFHGLGVSGEPVGSVVSLASPDGERILGLSPRLGLMELEQGRWHVIASEARRGLLRILPDPGDGAWVVSGTRLSRVRGRGWLARVAPATSSVFGEVGPVPKSGRGVR